MNLSAFLKQNALSVENEKVFISERFKDEKGNVLPFEIKRVSIAQDKAIKAECTKQKKVPGRKGMYIPELDVQTYFLKLTTACVVSPNLNDKSLQDSYGVMDAESLVQEMLLIGEMDKLTQSIQAINGNDISFEERVEEAKN